MVTVINRERGKGEVGGGISLRRDYRLFQPTSEDCSMPRFILAIRNPGSPDHVSFHDDEADARIALAAYVRRQVPLGRSSHSFDDDEAIAAWFDDQQARYVIGKVSEPSTMGTGS